ncbi:putative enterotoxin [Ophiocordyceps camponoti-rufipedis]|uniref:Putative enterotoxin n=1 Tax=Ophiocordyceps camponoti-rufipedis TaxID=2004952 RepID=A0A2C5ZKZ1_9HYPO|nr:putative enterotoxin [Ophiocordyceps camponoti-rufipedis]
MFRQLHWGLSLPGLTRFIFNGTKMTAPLVERRSVDAPNYCFRVDSKSPQEIIADGGFKPALNTGGYQDERVFSIYIHTQFPRSPAGTAYVSVTTEPGAALYVASPGHYIYRLICPPNSLDVNTALGVSSQTSWQQERVALGGIPSRYIVGWFEFRDRIRKPVDSARHVAKLTQKYEEKYSQLFTPNPGFDPGLMSAGNSFDDWMYKVFAWVLAGFWPSSDRHSYANVSPWCRYRDWDLADGARRFMNRFGGPAGWMTGQDFPLWECRPDYERGECRATEPRVWVKGEVSSDKYEAALVGTSCLPNS